MNKLKALWNRIENYYRSKSIQFTIAISFTFVAAACMAIMGFLLYGRFTANMRDTILRENTSLVNQIALNLNNYTANMRGVSNSMYYNVIKKADLAEQNLNREMSLFYQANTGSLVSIALYTERGELVAAAPNGSAKPYVDVRDQDWFIKANERIENSHFSAPHVQNLFSESSPKHKWVISLSRMVELTRAGTTSRGVLLVDISFSGIEMIFQQMSQESGGYMYLIDKDGEIIYHPRQKLIYSGLYEENNIEAARRPDGLHTEVFAGAERHVIVKTVSYTGWKIISVIPNSVFSGSFSQLRFLIVGIIGIAICLLVIMNSLVSSRVANPIKKLEQSVKELEQGSLDLEVYIGGPYEIERLGLTIYSAVNRMRELMDEIVEEQNRLRRSEFDALQAQINPHFLYNTLDSIVWMIESDRQQEAISMVTALANLFRISLSRGKNIIPIRSELQHARYYLHIQNIRYKNKFTVEYDIDPAIEDYTTIKLVIQPILENAIYHAMEMMDGDGAIQIRGAFRDGDIAIEVIDNGLGMTPDKAASLLEDAPVIPGKKGSGIGLKNVHQRIQLYYGKEYGLQIESKLDLGTTIRILLPAKQEQEPVPEDKGVTS